MVYGLDADLIMLSFVSAKEDVYLLRERQSFDKEYRDDKLCFNFLDINELKMGLVKFTEQEFDIVIKNMQQYLDDFVCFTFLLGNDFMPHLNSLSINNKGIEILIKNYIEMRKKLNSSLVSRNLMKINTNGLYTMLKEIVAKEEELVKSNSSKIHMNKEQQLNYYHKNWKRKQMHYRQRILSIKNRRFQAKLLLSFF